jgi:hypothetical protein
MYVGCGNVTMNIYKHIFQEECNYFFFYVDHPLNKMKCYYLAKELNNCLNMMNGLISLADE